MPENKYKVELSEDEVLKLKEITHKGKSSAREIMHANILLNTNDMKSNKKTVREIAEILDISTNTVNEVRKTYSDFGLEAAINRKSRLSPAVASKITGAFEASVIAMALGEVPKGRANWTLRLLAEQCMERKYIVNISHTAIGEMLNTNEVKPHLSKYWCIPKENDSHFVWRMEDVINIYHRPYNPSLPVICMDEKPIQLLDEIIERVSAKPLRCDPDTGFIKQGELEKIDYQYERCGTASIFMFCEPLKGWRFVRALERRTKGDFAMMMAEISDMFFPGADRVICVADNLNTHNGFSFY